MMFITAIYRKINCSSTRIPCVFKPVGSKAPSFAKATEDKPALNHPRRGLLALLLIAFILSPFDTQKPFETKPTLTPASNYQWSQDENAEFNTGTHSSTLADSNTVKLDKGDWWDDSWNYRKQLTITNASSNDWAANTTVQVTIDTKSFYDAGQLQADCDDLRIVYLTGGTNTELPRYYDIAQGATNCSDSEATIVYFPLQAALTNGSSSTDYYLYYGNSSATTHSNPENAFDIGDKDALLACPFHGDTTCAASETPSTETGAIRYSGAKSALSFDGNDDQVRITGNIDTAKTIEFWWRPAQTITSSPTEKAYSLFDVAGWGGATTGDWAVSIEHRTGQSGIGKVHFRIYQAGVGWHFIYSDSDTWTAGTWYHIAVILNSSGGMKMYVDGALQTDTNSYTGGLNTDTWYIGIPYDGHAGSLPIKGSIDEVAIYNDILTTEEITAHYNSGSPAPIEPDSNTVGLWHFDENGDDPRNTGRALDSSGNGNRGIISGAKYVSGLVGVDSSSSDTGKAPTQSYAGHSGVFVEEGTTNKITNPSFDHSTFNTNWNVETQPDGISGLQLWLKSDTGLYQDDACTTPVDTDGQAIGCWEDQSSNGYTGIQTTAKPTYKTNIFGSEAAVRFDGGDDSLNLTGMTNSAGNYTVFFVIDPVNTASGDTQIFWDSYSGRLFFTHRNDKVQYYTGATSYEGSQAATAEPQILTYVLEAPTSGAILRNGASLETGLNYSATAIGGTVRLGGGYGAGSRYPGDMAEMILYDSVLSNTQRQAIEQYLSSKYDISLSSGANPGLTENTTAPYYKFGNKSAKVVADADLNLTTSVNPGNTNTHTLSAYVYDATTGNEGGTVDNTIAQLVWEGSAQSGGTYTDMGGGWWRIDYSAATTNSANNYGVQVKSGKTVYVDGVQLEEKAYATTYVDGTMRNTNPNDTNDYGWDSDCSGTTPDHGGTAHNSCSIRKRAKPGYATDGNLSTSAGTVSLWAKINTITDHSGFLFGHNVGNNRIYIAYGATTGVSGIGLGDNGSLDTGITFETDKWYNVVLAWDGTDYEWWINNSSQGSGSFSGLTTLDTNFYVGKSKQDSDTNISNSTISDLRIYDSALSTDEVADLYYSGLTYHQSEAAANPYPSSGTFTSSVLDTSNPNVTYKTVTWDQTTPANTAITVDMRSAQNSAMTLNPTAWTNVTNGSNIPSLLDDKRFIQYRANLTTSDQFNTPTFGNLNIVYEIAPSDPTNFSGVALSTSSIQWNWNDTSDNEDEYYVEDESGIRISSNLGVNASSWTETDLSPNTLYTRHVSAVNATGEEESIGVSVYTLANTPGEPSVEQTGWTAQGWTTLKVTIDSSGNPDHTQFAIYETQTGKYVQADGTLGDTPVWRTYEEWGGAGGITVTGLTAAQTYDFQVKARNQDGVETQLSNVVSNYTYGNINEAETTCQTYTVQPGDTLVSIAQDIFGDWTRYTELIELNKDRYPSLQTNWSYIEIGWELVVSCQLLVDSEEKEDEEIGESVEDDSTTIEVHTDKEGYYTVKVKVIDSKEKPIQGAKVTLYSNTKEGKTDEQGETVFRDVEAGKHRVVVAYEGKKGEQEIKLEGDTQKIYITVRLEGISSITWLLALLGAIITILICIILYLLLKKRKQ